VIDRPGYLDRLITAIRRSPVTALLGPRQSGKTTLARMVAAGRPAIFYDLESQPDVRRLQNPELVLSSVDELVVIDEIQRMPELFAALRVLVDRPVLRARFLILGSASPDVVKNVSETLAGRVEFIELAPFDLAEVGAEYWRELWVRGGYPRAFLAASDEDSAAWRDSFIHTFLERDIPQLGFAIPPSSMRRFWTMLAHYHGQTWNASELGRAMGLSDKTVRSYLDLLTGAFMVRQLQPWYANIAKRQVRAPKVYLRDPGLLHSLLSLPDWASLLAHPRVGASWEGFAIEQALQAIRPAEAYFWATHSGVELDLLFFHRGRRYGVEAKFSEAPEVTRSMRVALEDLALDHLWVLHPGPHTYPVHEKITVCAIADLPSLFLSSLASRTTSGNG
jgi:predicted AAA+ superfamily ATPase